MNESPSTQPSLLARIRDSQDDAAWQRFVELYTPFIYGVFRRRGLQAADAADVAQEVLQTVASAIPRFEYDRGRGSFRSWLFSVARSRLNDHFRKRERQPVGSGETAVQEILAAQPEDSNEQAQWERSWKRHVLDWVSDRAREHFEPTTWKAFWSTAVEGTPVAQAARELGLSTGAVYIARSRVMAKLRTMIEDIDVDAVP
jgi:RNA polymerase sigma-70 factor (ECF subfamily)